MKRYRLLVVEDDEMSQRAWHTIFSRRGWDVVIASTVAEASALLEPTPDFLILDLSLADGEGEALLDKIRDDRLAMRVAITTGTSDPARLERVRGLYPEALLEKPVDILDVWRESEMAKTE